MSNMIFMIVNVLAMLGALCAALVVGTLIIFVIIVAIACLIAAGGDLVRDMKGDDNEAAKEIDP